jgi:hypothetical protein
MGAFAILKRMKFFLMAVIVCSLCFSVGEGLRLTPFPVFQVEDSNGLSVAKDAGGVKRTYGPLDVPSQAQKRTKRQTTDFGPQPRVETFQDVSLISHRFEELSVQLRSSRFIPRPAGRAPPVLP